MSFGTGNLLREAFEHTSHHTGAESFASPVELQDLLLKQTYVLIRATQLLNKRYFQQGKVNEIQRAYPKTDLLHTYQIQEIAEPYRGLYHSKNEQREIQSFTSIFPAERNETSQMKMKIGELGAGNLSFKSIPLNERRNYKDIFQKEVLERDRIVLQPLTTITRPIQVASYGNSRTPLEGTVYHSAIHTIRRNAWSRQKPELMRDISMRIVWSDTSASVLKLRSEEMKFNKVFAHLLLVNAIMNPSEGSAFSNND